jgi:hypothetical protein
LVRVKRSCSSSGLKAEEVQANVGPAVETSVRVASTSVRPAMQSLRIKVVAATGRMASRRGIV